MIKVVGISVRNHLLESLDDKDFESMEKGEHTEKLDKIGEFLDTIGKFCNEQFGDNYLGINIDGVSAILVFKAEIGRKGIKQVIETLDAKDYNSMVAGKGTIDERYLTDKRFNKFVVDLPLPYVDKAICDFFERNNLEYVIDQQINGNCVTYTANLDWQEIMFIANNKFLGGGMQQKKSHTTIEPQKDYKKIIAGVENDYLKWLEQHPVS